jgi:DNA invertase Pin-like site-specific DNA recombinase
MRKPPSASSTPRIVRCAVYTRKSTEEGLEQDFNSLDAQREACAAYILSQRHEGWTPVSDIYDDGGYSGGTIDRPALKALLAEIAAGRIDVIVVYKVDRLTRSLADFAKIVEILDDAGASFVSVTQSFNTTTSMGRLTLNVLLSFAQFEREVTGERIRDKIAASKAKGMWMGGPIPLGYRLEERKLLVDEHEAATIRMVFTRFLELGSGRALVAELDRDGVRSKQRINRHGRIYGQLPISRGALYAILQNRLYIGEVVHKGQSYPGQHDAIIDIALFDRVQATLGEKRVERRHGTNADQPSLLAGLMWDELGRRMSPSHAVKQGKRYRYYASQTDGDAASAQPAWRISAGDIEALVCERIVGRIQADADKQIAAGGLSSDEIVQLQEQFATRVQLLAAVATTARPALLELVERIEVGEEAITIAFQPSAMIGDAHSISIPIGVVRTGKRVRIIIPPVGASAEVKRNPALLKLIAQAFGARDAIENGGSFDVVAQQLGIGREYLADLIRTSYLAPSIVEAIVAGRQPPALTRKQIVTTNRIPLGWSEQRAMFGLD